LISLLVDEIDKMPAKDQASLLNLMETGIVSETKYGKTRSTQIKTSVFATNNNIKKISAAQQSRFFIAKVMVLSPIEGLNATEQKTGIGYIQKMYQDLAALKEGLQCKV